MAIEEVADEIATNLEEVAEVTRRIDTRAVSFLLGGVVIGVGIGFYFGHRWNSAKIRAEAFKQSDEEINRMREMYRLREIAAREAHEDAEIVEPRGVIVADPKPSVEEIIEERGYSTRTEERPLKPPVPVDEARTPIVVTPPPVVIYEGGKSKDENWNYPLELSRRTTDAPYIIHQDEFNAQENDYSQVVYTYYAVDDVLADTDGTPLAHGDLVVGQNNLRFGHGTDDIDVVYVRNDKLELEMEICRVPKSYEEEVLGNGPHETN